MSDRYIVGDLVAEFLQAVGVTTAFGLVSVHNIPMLDAIGRRNAIRFVKARGEHGAGHMADAFIRASGDLAVLFTSTGPGAANGIPALVEAGFAGTPLIHITGQTASGNIDRDQGPVHDLPGQLAMLESVSKSAYRVRDEASALGTLTRAVSDALTPPMGPVSIEIPIDVQRTAIDRPAALDGHLLALPAPAPAPTAHLDEAAAMLRAAKRPMLWTGNGAKFAGAAVRRLVDMGLPLATSWNGRAVIPEDHPRNFAGLYAAPELVEFYQSVDLLIVAGCRLRGHETADLSLALPARRIHIDIDPAANGRTYGNDLFLCGEAGATLAALADRVDGQLTLDAALGDAAAAAKTAAEAGFKDFLGTYADMPAVVRAAMPADALWVRDVTMNNTTWGNRWFPLNAPRDNIYPISAAIGPGLPLGIGAALGAGGRKTVMMSGDGGFAINLAELWTAMDEGVDAVFMIMNDHGYGVIKHIQTSLYGGRHYFADPSAPDYRGLAALCGMPFFHSDTVAGVGPALEAALAVDGPAMVEVDMSAIGAYPTYYKPPPYADKD